MSDNSKYETSGVSASGAGSALDSLLKHVKASKHFSMRYPVKADIGYFANVIDIGNGQGIALCTDGVGTKVVVAEMMGKYDTIGIDCVAMNVNDLICIGARPVSMVDYIACSHTDPVVFEALGKGLAEGAKQSGISISGGEISQVKEIVNGIDLIGAAIGHVELDKVNTGREIKPGNLILGLASTGVHSNGLTLARRVLLGDTLEEQKQNVHSRVDSLDGSIGEELLIPTRIYVNAILGLLEADIDMKAMVHVTGGGLTNLNRVENENLQFVIDHPLPVPPVFHLIKEKGQVSDAEMHEVFNMGIGFCIVVEDEKAAQATVAVCEKFNTPCDLIGRVEKGEGLSVSLPNNKLKGVGSSMIPV